MQRSACAVQEAHRNVGGRGSAEDSRALRRPHLVNLVDAACVEQDALRQRRLPAVYVCGDADIAQVGERLRNEDGELLRQNRTVTRRKRRALSSSATGAGASCEERRSQAAVQARAGGGACGVALNARLHAPRSARVSAAMAGATRQAEVANVRIAFEDSDEEDAQASTQGGDGRDFLC